MGSNGVGASILDRQSDIGGPQEGTLPTVASLAALAPSHADTSECSAAKDLKPVPREFVAFSDSTS